MNMVLRRLQTKGSSPLSPLNIFSLDYSSAAALAGLILTYMMVLLQFKVGDASDREFYGSSAQ